MTEAKYPLGALLMCRIIELWNYRITIIVAIISEAKHPLETICFCLLQNYGITTVFHTSEANHYLAVE